MAESRAAAVQKRREELLTANKEAARLLLVSISLGSSSVSYYDKPERSK